ncbi:required for meiotic nuclear division protein 1 [Gammaproteobacteria bacterium]
MIAPHFLGINMRCVSFCTTESYHLATIAGFFRAKAYNIKQYRKVLHISYPPKEGDIFIFSYGCFVTWGLSRSEEKQLLEQLKPFSINPLPTIEIGRFVYRHGDQTEMATHGRFNIDIIVLESESMQLKLAISYGLAQSIQLESYESAVQKTIEQNAHYPKQLAKQGHIHLSQKEISRCMGQIFLARSSINLNSEYLAAPEYFWEHPSLEDYYNISEKFLDIPRRVSTLNQKLDVLHELFDMLSSQLQHRHSNILESIIIILIVVEIVISLIAFIK